AIEVDLSDVAPQANVPHDDPVELARRVRHDPRDEATLHALYRVYGKRGDEDRALSVADVLAYLGVASAEQKDLLAKHKVGGLIRPTAPLGGDAWTRLLFHPEEEPLVGEIFAVVAPAVLLGRISALRRDKALPKLDPGKKQDPAKS